MMMEKALAARFCCVRAKVLESLGDADEAENEAGMAYEHAHDIGWAACRTNAEMPDLLRQEKLLVHGWTEGKLDAQRHEGFLAEASSGSQEEWDALSTAEQEAQWDEFHDLCARGIADEMYFYQVMMNKHMVGYVGH